MCRVLHELAGSLQGIMLCIVCAELGPEFDQRSAIVFLGFGQVLSPTPSDFHRMYCVPSQLTPPLIRA